MTLLPEIVDIVSFQNDVMNGYIRVQTHPEIPSLRIANYTPEAQFKKYWNANTLNARGLIWDTETWEVLARPFKKFFNFNEGWEPNTPPPDYASRLFEQVEVTDKVDGSLGILYFAAGMPWIATRGSFASEQARHATRLFRDKYLGFKPADGYTALFEIVYPENRIVLDYKGQDDLILLGSVHMQTGTPFGPKYIATQSWPGPKAKTFKYKTLADALAAEPRPNAEGLVVKFNDGLMLKIKQEDYKALHKLVTGINEKYIWEALKGGASVTEIVSPLPDEFHDWVKTTAEDILVRHDSILGAAVNEFTAIVKAMGFDIWTPSHEVDRKKFAAAATQTPFPGLLFMLLDGKSIDSTVWKMVQPSGDRGPTKFNDETV